MNDKNILEEGDIICTVDVSSLYTNIPQSEGIKACRDVLEKYYDDQKMVDFIIKDGLNYTSLYSEDHKDQQMKLKSDAESKTLGRRMTTLTLHRIKFPNYHLKTIQGLLQIALCLSRSGSVYHLMAQVKKNLNATFVKPLKDVEQKIYIQKISKI